MNNAESRLQQACVRWVRYQYPDLVVYAIPNGGKRNAVTGAILKAEGVLAGVVGSLRVRRLLSVLWFVRGIGMLFVGRLRILRVWCGGTLRAVSY